MRKEVQYNLALKRAESMKSTRSIEPSEEAALQQALADPFYTGCYRHYGTLEKVIEAGFFKSDFDLEPYLQDQLLFTTPIDKIDLKRAEQTAKKPLVLLSTGKFSPLHLGHLAMMESAKTAAEENGSVVIGGYLSPSHDQYVFQKTEELQCLERVLLSQKTVQNSDWLMIDPWESCYVHKAINFTDVIRRLEKYLQIYLKQEVEIGYVFGEDNAFFARTFVEKGMGICVQREGYQKTKMLEAEAELLNSGRILVVPGNNNGSSTKIRKGDTEYLPKSINTAYRDFAEKKTRAKELEQSGSPAKIYLIRDEGEEHYAESGNYNQHLPQSKALFLEKLSEAILSSAEHTNIQIKVLEAATQNKEIEKISGKIISLDSFITADYYLPISRSFKLSDGQIQSSTFVERPESSTSNQEEQKKLGDSIPPGEYILIDDDIATGKTIESALSTLADQVKISKVCSLAELFFRKEEIEDIVDLRDFIIGAPRGGLVLELPDKSLVRAPYLLPYVSPSSRAKIEPSKALAFSKKIWELNKEFYQKTGPELTVAALSEQHQRWLDFVGFDKSINLVDLCQWHVDQLSYLGDRPR